MLPLLSKRTLRGIVATLGALALLSACASADVAQDTAAQAALASTTVPATSTSTTVASTTTTTAASSTTTTAASSTTTTAASSTTTTAASSTTTAASSTTTVQLQVESEFVAEVFEIAGPLADRFTHSWREGCPVGLDELRLVTATHWGYDGEVRSGELVIHADYSDDIIFVLSELFDAKFPIERMELVDNFAGDDNLSMDANNTSAFNCREVASNPGSWSNHAFGAAIDINPVANPYLRGDMVLPPAGVESIDRSVRVIGGIYPGDAVTQAFAEIGWGWGGEWNSVKDWQHFSANGN